MGDNQTTNIKDLFFKLRTDTSSAKNTVSEEAKKLKQVIESNGVYVLSNIEKLESELRRQGCEEKNIYQYLTALTGGTIQNYLDRIDNGLDSIEIDNILRGTKNAGLSDATARQVVSDFLYALDVPQVMTGLTFDTLYKKENPHHLYVPRDVYERELELIRTDMSKELKEADFRRLGERLSLLDKAGIPDAKALLGQLYILADHDPDTGMNLLYSAAMDDNKEACALYADEMFLKESYDDALRFYTQSTGKSLTAKRRKNVRNLYLLSGENRKLTAILCFYLIAFELMMWIIVPKLAFAADRPWIFWICTVANVLIMVISLLKLLKKPLMRLDLLIAATAASSFIYFLGIML